ncbi:hypothetical protein MBLNU457_5393t1 [Dothideomycetes sp. NU457]
MAIKTQAYVSHSPDSGIVLEDIEYDDVGEGEVLVEIVAFSVCASDIKAAAGMFHLSPPLVLGHEASGIVKQVGASVPSHLTPGTQVLLSYTSCKTCKTCLSGSNAYCTSLRPLNFGGHRPSSNSSSPSTAVTTQSGQQLKSFFFGQSSMTRLALADHRSLVPVNLSPSDLTTCAALTCGIQTGASTILNILRPRPSSSILIIGAGSVGLAAALAARLSHPSKLTVLDTNDAKFNLIPDVLTKEAYFSTSNTTSIAPEDLAQKLKDATPNGLGYDYILDCAGSPASISQLYPALAPRGTIVTVGGAAPGAKVEIEVNAALIGGRTYRGTHQGDAVPGIFLPEMIDLWKKGLFPFEELVTRYGFEDVPKALEDLKEGRCVKALFVTGAVEG